MLAQSELGRLFIRSNNLDDDDEDDDGTSNSGSLRRRRRPPPDPDRFPKVPSEKGEELMNSGDFGSSEIQAGSRVAREKNLARRILDRELGADNSARERANQRLMAQVRPLNRSVCTSLTSYPIGNDTILNRRYNHTLQRSCLFWTILR